MPLNFLKIFFKFKFITHEIKKKTEERQDVKEQVNDKIKVLPQADPGVNATVKIRKLLHASVPYSIK